MSDDPLNFLQGAFVAEPERDPPKREVSEAIPQEKEDQDLDRVEGAREAAVPDPRLDGIVIGETPILEIVRKHASKGVYKDGKCVVPKGTPIIPTETWNKIVHCKKKKDDDDQSPAYRTSEILRAFAKHIVEAKVPYPRPNPTLSDARSSFKKLRDTSRNLFLSEYKPEEVVYVTREPYKHWSDSKICGVAKPEINYRPSSGHWHDKNRLRCPGGWNKGTLSVWEDEKALSKVRWPFWAITDGPCNMEAWRKGVSVAPGIFIASQFSPAIAKCMYEWLPHEGARIVFDPSCGWGDRLAGFFATESTEVYCGCDPHPKSYPLYKEQCRAYEEWLGNSEPEIQEFEIAGYPAFFSRGGKQVLIINGPFEDIPWEGICDKLPEGFDFVFTSPPRFDLVFTSPPYFEIEHYAKGELKADLQTWSRYPDFSDWLDKFFYPLLRRCYEMLCEGGYMAINIADTVLRPSSGKAEHYKVADPMVDYMLSKGAHYCGALAMVLRKRPSDNERMKDLTLINYAEPIWIFQRGGDGTAPKLHGSPVDEDVEKMIKKKGMGDE